MSEAETPRGQTFWNELYWFVAIGLMGWILAAILLPPRITQTAQLLRVERDLQSDLTMLRKYEVALGDMVSAFENDPVWREDVFRQRLNLKKNTEEYLEPLPPPVR